VPKLTPSQKGAAAEAALTAAAVELGFVVLRPLCEGGRYDLILDLEPELVRVQCKCARCSGGALPGAARDEPVYSERRRSHDVFR
jgi:hypothetical protein